MQSGNGKAERVGAIATLWGGTTSEADPLPSLSELSEFFATKAELAALQEELRGLRSKAAAETKNEAGLAVLQEELGQLKARLNDADRKRQEEEEEVQSKLDGKPPVDPPSDTSASIEATEEKVSFQESMWDAAMFIGLPEVGAAGSCILAVGLLVNILIQFVFIMIIYTNLAEKVFSDEDLSGLSAFRDKIAHDSRFLSEANRVSLADRVCNLDLSLEIATTQLTTLTEINDYLGVEGELSEYLNGPRMCQLALIVWILCILKEVSAAFNIFSAVRRLPSHRGRSDVVPSLENSFKLVDMSRSRKLFALLLCMMRLTVAVTLLWIGTYYLCYTTSIGDLLLNAIALEVVINVDELVYSALAPASACEMINGLEPLSTVPWPRWRGADFRSLCTPIVVVGLMVACQLTSLSNTVQNLEDARTRLCGQRRNFVYEFDGLGMVRIQNLQEFDVDQAYDVSGLASLAVQEVKDVTRSQFQWEYALLSPRTDNQRYMDQVSVREMMSAVADIYSTRQGLGEAEVRDCHNAYDRIEALEDMPILRNEWRAWPGYLGRALGLSEPATSCQQVREYCSYSPGLSHLAMAMMRALCPVTCGCNSLVQGTLFTSTDMGCPQVCLIAQPAEERNAQECEDTVPGSGAWQEAALQAMFQEIWLAYPNTSFANAVEVWDTYGCRLARSGTDLCMPMAGSNLITQLVSVASLPTHFGKILAMLCPKECNCDGENPSLQRPPSQACPKSCICDWTIQPAISRTAVEDQCEVPNPYRVFGPDLPQNPGWTLSMDAQCCWLIRNFMHIAEATQLGQLPVTSLSIQDRQLLVEMDAHLCASCRRQCKNQLVSLVANATLRTPEAAAVDICVGY